MKQIKLLNLFETFISDSLRIFTTYYLFFHSIFIKSIKKFSKIQEVNPVNSRLFENM